MNAFAPVARVVLGGLLLLTFTVTAQVPPGGGRQRGGGEKSGMTRAAPERNAARGSTAIDPVAAINRELPSLKVDMRITPEQAPLWEAFAASVREANNVAINRAKREAQARPRDDAAKPDITDAPPALTLLATLADEDAQRAAAMAAVKARAAALIEILTLEQRRMFDRRIALAQREPLGGF
jgi:hypothetical protein